MGMLHQLCLSCAVLGVGWGVEEATQDEGLENARDYCLSRIIYKTIINLTSDWSCGFGSDLSNF